MSALLDIADLSVSYPRGASRSRILDDLSLAIDRGQSLGIVGESGAGKTVLVRAIMGLLRPPWQVERGRICYEGRDLVRTPEEVLLKLRGKQIALTSPEPRKHLNPLLRIGEQLVNVITAHAELTRRQAGQRAVDLLAQVGIPDPHRRAFSYPHELSGGMCQRVVIAQALAHSPRLLIADEPTAGLDVTISRQILDLMQDLVRQSNSALIIVSRDLGVVAHYCQRVAVMHAGLVVEIGDVKSFFAQAVHPYSQHLLRAAAAARERGRGAQRWLGASVAPNPAGCGYAGRCRLAEPHCREIRPRLETTRARYAVRCHRRAAIISREIEP